MGTASLRLRDGGIAVEKCVDVARVRRMGCRVFVSLTRIVSKVPSQLVMIFRLSFCSPERESRPAMMFLALLNASQGDPAGVQTVSQRRCYTSLLARFTQWKPDKMQGPLIGFGPVH